MSTPEFTITTIGEWFSEPEGVTVEHRGAMMGKLYVYTQPSCEVIEAVLMWTGKGNIRPVGIIEPTREQKNRAVRALAASPWGAKALPEYQLEPTVPRDVRNDVLLAEMARLKAENTELRTDLARITKRHNDLLDKLVEG